MTTRHALFSKPCCLVVIGSCRRWTLVTLGGLLLQGCGGKAVITQEQIQASRYTVARDHAPPATDLDVSTLADAIPRPPEGPVKSSPYSLYGVRYTPLRSAAGYQEEGLASWYGVRFHGHKTANGESYNMYAMTAAHKTLPLPSYAKVTSLDTGHSVLVRVNDRGPYHGDRLIDLSWAAARKLGTDAKGVAHVRVEGIDTTPAGIAAFWQQELNSRPLTGKGARAYLQVAALKSRQKALSLKEALEQRLAVPVHLVPTPMKTLLKVLAGPFPSRKSLQEARHQVQGCCQLKAYPVKKPVGVKNIM